MKETKERNDFIKLIKKLFDKPQIFKDFERPKELPPLATDCGFSHGKPKEK